MSSVVHFDPLFHIRVYSHFFKITKIQPGARAALDKFLLKYVHVGFRPNENTVTNTDKLYAEVSKDGMEYRFHRGQYEEFEKHLLNHGLTPSLWTVDHQPMFETQPMRTKMKGDKPLRGQQPEAVNFITNYDEFAFRSKLVTAPMGSGKTLMAVHAAVEMNKRCVIIVLPGYVEKWVTDIIGTDKTPGLTDGGKKDVMKIRGGDSIRGLIAMAREGTFKSDWTVIALTSWINYLKAYQTDRQACIEDYGCAPEEVYELLGVGTVIIDEIHQQLYSVYKTTTYMHVDTLIGLSGTFLSIDQFVEKIQKTLFPREMRFTEIKPTKHIGAYGIAYAITPESLKKIRTTERGSSTYSQTAFEKSILKYPDLKKNYMRLIGEVFENGYMDEYKKGDKAIIFARTTAMCESIVTDIKSRYPQLDVRKYTMEDPFENIIDADVRVTTQQSGGTAIDISNLLTNITTDNMRSPQANLQCKGRLRDIPGRTPRYFAVYSENISSHSKYHGERRKLFADNVKFFKEFKSRVAI